VWLLVGFPPLSKVLRRAWKIFQLLHERLVLGSGCAAQYADQCLTNGAPWLSPISAGVDAQKMELRRR
jgi:hypothetical protein